MQRPGSKNARRLSYAIKIVPGSPGCQITIFRETSRFVRAYMNGQCFRILSASQRVGFKLPGKLTQRDTVIDDGEEEATESRQDAER